MTIASSDHRIFTAQSHQEKRAWVDAVHRVLAEYHGQTVMPEDRGNSGFRLHATGEKVQSIKGGKEGKKQKKTRKRQVFPRVFALFIDPLSISHTRTFSFFFLFFLVLQGVAAGRA